MGVPVRGEAGRRAIQHESREPKGFRQTPQGHPENQMAQTLLGSPKQAGSTLLCSEGEAVAVVLLRHTLLPLHDCLYALQATIPQLTRSSLHRCLQRNRPSRLPEAEEDRPARKNFKTDAIGDFHIDIA